MEDILNHSSQMIKAYENANSRIFFIDYDGTLAQFKNSPGAAFPTKEIKEVLTKLGSDDRNRVVILSGREKETLQSWLGNLPVTLAAEHGGFYKEQFDDWSDFFEISTDWMPHIFSCLRALTYDFAGSFIEQKSYSLVWHYRSIAHTLKNGVVNQIKDAILAARVNHEFELYQEDCAIEIRTAGVDKGTFAKKYMRPKRYDFILAMGDGKTDEDLFKALERNCYTIKVGQASNSAARFFVENQEKVLTTLQMLADSSKNSNTNRSYETHLDPIN